MGSRQLNQLLWSVATFCVAVGLVVGGVTALAPLDLPAVSQHARDASTTTKLSTPAAAQTAVSLVGRTFRASAASIAPAPAEPAASSGNELSAVHLVGTIGDSIAMLRGPDGSTALVEVGDDVNGAAVLAIRPYQVDFKLNGRTTTLVKSDASDNNASDPNAAAWPSQP